MNHPTMSKINWTALAIALVNMAAALGYLPDDVREQAVIIANTLGPVLIVIFRTWFTGPK